jgi:hypothetical protein
MCIGMPVRVIALFMALFSAGKISGKTVTAILRNSRLFLRDSN